MAMSDLLVGDRVTMTERALVQKLDGRLKRRTGTVTRILDDTVWVRRDGCNQNEQWHIDFWAKIKPRQKASGVIKSDAG